MTTPVQPTAHGHSSKSLVLSALGWLAVIALGAIVWQTPEWYAYLNWRPGLAAAIASPVGYFIPAVITLVIATQMVTRKAYVYFPVLVACFFWLFNSQAMIRHIGYATGVAKVECWTPDTRECLVGKFQRLELLKEHKVPVVLTEKEQAVFQAFKQTRDKFEASKPSGFGDDVKNWAQDYRTALDTVFAGYPSAYPK